MRIGELVLARGVQPNEVVAAEYRPRDGEPSSNVQEIRVLHLPAQLARLGALTGDARYRAVARGAVLEFEYAHFWPGTWRNIDPGFDDTFGNVAQAGVALWRAYPDEPVFRRLPLSGYKRYAPLWRDALRYGGNVAADQVRCWRILADVAELQPELKERVPGLLLDAARSHFRGQQGEGGIWSDVTVVGFDPKANLGVGDTAGLPQNLLEGLAVIYDRELGLSEEERREVRAMYTAVLRSTRTSYRHAFGYREARRGAGRPQASVSAFGSVRVLPGLVEMLRRLSP